jgi:hypothetical protein
VSYALGIARGTSGDIFGLFQMAARKRNPLQKLKGIVRLLAQGLTVKQACSVYSCSDEWFFGHTRAGHEYEYLRDEAEAAMVSARLRAIDKIGKDAHKAGDYKTALNAATWKLEKLSMYRKQFGVDAAVQLNQQFNTLNLTDGQTLEQARAALEEVKRIKDARRANAVAGNGSNEHAQ